MVQYFLYKKRNLITPFVVINENTTDSSSSSLLLVGKRTENYGQSEHQSLVWLLENFANSTKPAASVLGQEWFNTTDNKMYVCVDESGQTFEKIGKPLVASSAPSLNLSAGDLWYNTNDGRLYSYNGTVWGIVGPISTVPTTAQQINYLTGITTDGVPTEIFINGVNGSRLVISANQSWLFSIDIIGRVIQTTSEVVSMRIKGTFDRPNLGNVNIPGGVSTEIFNITSSLAGTVTASVSASVPNNALSVTVTGQAGTNIRWNAICTVTVVSN